MSETGGLVLRRNVVKPPAENGAASSSKPEDRDVKDGRDSDAEDVDSKETRLTLMEEVLLLGLKDKEVNVKLNLLTSVIIKIITLFNLGLYILLERLHLQWFTGMHSN